MADCEKAADHVAQVRTPTNKTTKGIEGAWKFSFSLRGQDRHEPNHTMQSIPYASEI